jgi:hypothetical protein
MTNEIERMFEQHGHRLKAAMEKLNEIGAFGGQVYETVDEYGWELGCGKWAATATFQDAYEMGDADEVGQLANITVFCCATGGQLLPGFIPHNYTPTVWCNLTSGEGKEEFLARLTVLEKCLEPFATEIKERLGQLEREGALT